MNLFTQLMPATPQIFLLIMGIMGLLITALNKATKTDTVFYFVEFALLAAAFLFWQFSGGQHIFAFDKSFIADHLATCCNIFICFYTFVVLIYSHTYLIKYKMPQDEYYLLALFCVLGMTILVCGYSLLTIYMGLELLSLSTYAMVALRRTDLLAIEAAVKYFLMGAVASALLLYGISMIFGATHSLNIYQIAKFSSTAPLVDHKILVFGLLFLFVGFAFKTGAAPFHMWVPDVYQGAPAPVTLFIASTPKIAAFALAIRLFPEAFPSLHIVWSHALILLAVLSMAVGNIAALMQTQLKRLLAYSSIAHVGYILLALSCATARGFSAALFYMITYTLMTLVAFGILSMLSCDGKELIEVDQLRGLNKYRPWLAFILLVVMFSMAGIPPLVGFMAKLGILEALIEVHQVWLATIAIIFAIIGVYYYIRVVKVMYFEEPSEQAPLLLATFGRTTLTLNTLLILFLGMVPGWLFLICHLVNF